MSKELYIHRDNLHSVGHLLLKLHRHRTPLLFVLDTGVLCVVLRYVVFETYRRRPFSGVVKYFTHFHLPLSILGALSGSQEDVSSTKSVGLMSESCVAKTSLYLYARRAAN